MPDPLSEIDPADVEGDPDQRGGGQAATEGRIAKHDESDRGEQGARFEYNPREDPGYEGVERPADLAGPSGSGGERAQGAAADGDVEMGEGAAAEAPKEEGGEAGIRSAEREGQVEAAAQPPPA